MVNDLRRAYFYVNTSRDIYIELPAEDLDGSKDQLGKLNFSLYGTRETRPPTGKSTCRDISRKQAS